MPFSSIDLWHRISDAELASPQLCRTWAAQAAQSLPPHEAADGKMVLSKLVESCLLTSDQAACLMGETDGDLQRDGWHILGPVQERLFQGWWEIACIDPDSGLRQDVRWGR